jgi:hypothetical protein
MYALVVLRKAIDTHEETARCAWGEDRRRLLLKTLGDVFRILTMIYGKEKDSWPVMWEKVRDKLTECARAGVRPVGLWWRTEWGPSPVVNSKGFFFNVPNTNKQVRRAIRRKRRVALLALMRWGIPMDVRIHLCTYFLY